MMMMIYSRFRWVPPLTLLLVGPLGCQEENTPPTATIDSPDNGTTLYPGPITFQGTVSDAETPADQLSVSFDAGSAGACDAEVTEEGVATCEIVFETEGTFGVTLWVMDDIGQKASDEIEISLYDAPPNVVIVSPDVNAPPTLTDQDPLTIVASTDDPDDVSLECTFESSLDGVLGTALVDPGSSQCTLADITLSGGTHTVSVTVTDAFGKEARASYQQPVTPCTDYDGDGYFAECGQRDCNDADPATYPGAEETCNGRDSNCDNLVDNVDQDGDGYTSCEPAPTGDCDDTDFLVHPNAEELCDGIDNDCDGETDEGFDKDHDGISSCDGDCDDSDRFVHPDADEVCDGKDNNCDGQVDEGVLLTLYYDVDLDGHGDPSQPPAEVCETMPGLSSVADDCDDLDANVYPGADELCNGQDDDCDGDIDEGTTPLTFYQDQDGDGYGDAGGVTEETCTPSPGFVLETGDCDDQDPAAHPGATEICNSKDDDCDGETDEDVTTTYYPDQDGDGYGASDPQAGCDIPNGFVANDDDCDDTRNSVHPGANEMCNELDDDCNGVVDDNVETYTFYQDSDGDGFGSTSSTEACAPPAGYVLEDGDCDDGDINVYPGAEETCNGVDDDCDGSTDEDVKTLYWRDSDGDGHGGDTESVKACEAPSGFVSSNDDCYDDNPAAYPGADEACDGIDTNCNGVVDEGFEPLIVFYLDADQDGYGSNDPDEYTLACATPPGYSENNQDCDDADPTIFPDAAEDANGKDDDCDGLIDEDTGCSDDDGDGYIEQTPSTCPGYPEMFGTPAPEGGDCDDTDSSVHPGQDDVMNGKDDDCDGMADEGSDCADDDGDGYIESSDPSDCPGYPDVYGSPVPEGSDCNDDDATIHPSAPERFNGRDDSCDGLVDEIIPLGAQQVVLTGETNEGQAGYAVAPLGDLNGDGFDDAGVGAPGYYVDRGAVHVLFGKATGWETQGLESASTTYNVDSDSGARFGSSLAASDLDGDGYDDLAASAPYRAGEKGTLYLLYGHPGGWSGGTVDGPNSVADAYADGKADETFMGYAVSGGCNVDGDPNDVEELAVGVPWGNAGYLLFLPGKKDVRYQGSIEPDDFAKVEGNSNDLIGRSVAMLGDVNKDGWCDVLVGGEGSLPSGRGVAYYIPGYHSMTPGGVISLDEAGAVGFTGRNADEFVGYSVAGAGDVDGDGLLDFMIGRKARPGDSEGVAYLFYTTPDSDNEGPVQRAADAYFMAGEGDVCPCVVAGLGDVDGDGYDDIAVGLSSSSEYAPTGGVVYLFYGSAMRLEGAVELADADVRFIGSEGDLAGFSVSRAGDLNGDGFSDFLIGAPGHDTIDWTDAGRVTVLFGFARD